MQIDKVYVKDLIWKDALIIRLKNWLIKVEIKVKFK